MLQFHHYAQLLTTTSWTLSTAFSRNNLLNAVAVLLMTNRVKKTMPRSSEQIHCLSDMCRMQRALSLVYLTSGCKPQWVLSSLQTLHPRSRHPSLAVWWRRCHRHKPRGRFHFGCIAGSLLAHSAFTLIVWDIRKRSTRSRRHIFIDQYIRNHSTFSCLFLNQHPSQRDVPWIIHVAMII